MAAGEERQRTDGDYYDVDAFTAALELGAAVRQARLSSPVFQQMVAEIKANPTETDISK